ncbi:hypothetical protein DRN67_03125 [Candidatus Micrarchaeota archaeon]|nr:MAG: hypothetical protein DRN67_03125 [Candidatus Micrarchaeota archaeon]
MAGAMQQPAANRRTAKLMLQPVKGSGSLVLPWLETAENGEVFPKGAIRLQRFYSTLSRAMKPAPDLSPDLNARSAVLVAFASDCVWAKENSMEVSILVEPAILLAKSSSQTLHLLSNTNPKNAINVPFDLSFSEVEAYLGSEQSYPTVYTLALPPQHIFVADLKARLLAEFFTPELTAELGEILFSISSRERKSEALLESKARGLFISLLEAAPDSLKESVMGVLKRFGLFNETESPQRIDGILSQPPVDEAGLNLMDANKVRLMITYGTWN